VREQRRKRRGRKVYSLHAPEVECIGKDKARRPYESGGGDDTLFRSKSGQLVAHAKALPGKASSPIAAVAATTPPSRARSTLLAALSKDCKTKVWKISQTAEPNEGSFADIHTPISQSAPRSCRKVTENALT
jgi:hypothetical protein